MTRSSDNLFSRTSYIRPSGQFFFSFLFLVPQKNENFKKQQNSGGGLGWLGGWVVGWLGWWLCVGYRVVMIF